MPGPIAITVFFSVIATSAGSSGARIAIDPESVSANGSVIISGAYDAIDEIADAAEATVESPAPARNAAIPAIAAAPVFPRPPAITRTWPYRPLFESLNRGRNSGAKSAGSDNESKMFESP